MSNLVAVRAALEVALAAVSPSIATAFENADFQPPAAKVPYQQAFVLFATPDNQEVGAMFMELGYMQVTLKYPLQDGTAAAAARADILRAAFKRGTTLVNSGISVVVNRTPAVGNGVVDGDRWSVPVKIPFHANIAS